MFCSNTRICSDIHGLFCMYNSTVTGISSSAFSRNHQLSDLIPSFVVYVNVGAKEVGLLVY